MAAFYGVVLLTCAAGFIYARKGGRGYLFSVLVAASCAVSVIAMFSFISAYIYESPSHHCPFCMLQGEYGYVGYPLYLALLGGTITGLGVGVLQPFRKIPSLSTTLPVTQRRLALAASILFLLFAAIVTLEVLLSNLKY
jgi:hypothetical protein